VAGQGEITGYIIQLIAASDADEGCTSHRPPTASVAAAVYLLHPIYLYICTTADLVGLQKGLRFEVAQYVHWYIVPPAMDRYYFTRTPATGCEVLP